jgi:sorbitol/mannitol transport system permease protein
MAVAGAHPQAAQPTIGQANRPDYSRELDDQKIGRRLVLPALFYAILVTQLPFLLTLWYSLQRWNLNSPQRRGFVGFDNYVYLVTRDPSFWPAVANTATMIIGSVVASLALGLLFAELVNHRFPGGGSSARC